MKKAFKRCAFALVLTLALAVSAFAAQVISSGTCGGDGDGSNLAWTLDDEGTLRIDGKGKMKDYYDDHNCVSLSPWLNLCSSIKSLVIGNGVTSICDAAFYGCNRLTSVTIPSSITSIGDVAFGRCSNLKSAYITDLAAWCKIEFVNGSNPLGNGRDLYINGEKATNIEIPKGVTRIGDHAFSGYDSLMTVTVPESVKSVGSCAFEDCKNLKDVYYTGTEEAWKHILRGSFNDPLESANIRYNATVLFPSVSQTADGTAYKVNAANLPVSSAVIVALYKDGRFVGYESAVYNGEALDISTQTPHDAATVMAWKALDKFLPLAPAAKI